MPFVTGRHLSSLLDGFELDGAPIVASTRGASPMPPALFDRRYFPQLVEGRGDVGARDLLTGARLVAGAPADLADIDRPHGLRCTGQLGTPPVRASRGTSREIAVV